jgi:hypothetical protein
VLRHEHLNQRTYQAGDYFLAPVVVMMGALTPINQNAIKKGKCGNLECGQTERGKSEGDKAHISVDPDFAQTDFAQTESAKTMFCKSGIP